MSLTLKCINIRVVRQITFSESNYSNVSFPTCSCTTDSRAVPLPFLDMESKSPLLKSRERVTASTQQSSVEMTQLQGWVRKIQDTSTLFTGTLGLGVLSHR